MKKLDSKALGWAAAAISAISMLVLGLLAMGGFYPEGFEVMKAFHLVFDKTHVGIILGMVEAAVLSYAWGYFFGVIYNKLAK